MPTKYDVRRRNLIKLICPAKRCHHCKRKAPSWSSIEIDHLDGKSWVSNRVNSMQRLRIMEREVAAGGRLVGSCGHCNHKMGATMRYPWRTKKVRDAAGQNYSRFAVEYQRHMEEQRAREEYREEVDLERQAANDAWEGSNADGKERSVATTEAVHHVEGRGDSLLDVPF